MISDLAIGPHPSTIVSRAEIVALQQVSDWGDFYRGLARHRLFSGVINAEDIVLIWNKIRGFDVDCLLDIGDPDALASRLDDNVTARYGVGRMVAEAAHRTGRSIAKDEHVHFGQLVDLGLLWHWQMRDESCRWSQYGPRLDQKQSFLGGSRTISGERALPRAVHRWGSCMARARLLFAYASNFPDHLANGDAEAAEFLGQVLECGDSARRGADNELSAFEHNQLSLLLKGGKVMMERSITEERKLVANLARETARPLARAYAAAYATLKSAAMHAVCGNAVAGPINERFDRFTSALGSLDQIYAMNERAFGDYDEFVTISRRHLEVGSSLLPRVLFRASRKSMGLGDRGGLRHFVSQWKTANQLFEPKHSKLVLSFQRADFLNNADAFNDIVEAIVEKRDEWERELSCSIVGLDLCGPEMLDIVAAKSVVGEQAPTAMLLDPIDRVFELRERLSDNDRDPIYVSFHAGEHVVDWELGCLATLAIATDARFNAASDRLSHALIVCVAHEEWAPPSVASRSARGAARDRVRTNCIRGTGALFNESERKRMIAALDDLNKGDQKALIEICAAVRDKIVSGEIAIEVCPYSNLMIRGIPPESHPWVQAVANGRVFIGTDDPSLTQTLPWVEQAAMEVGVRAKR